VSAIIFILNGQPVQTLVLVGALNGFILPFSLGIILFAAYREKITGTYRHPVWLTVFGVLVAAATLWFSILTIAGFITR
jgi:Mn2+/Fe2+ NRAMP family transporter